MMGRKSKAKPMAAEEEDPLVSLRLDPSLAPKEDDHKRWSACRKFLKQNAELAPSDGLLTNQVFCVRLSALRDYANRFCKEPRGMADELRYMRLLLLLLVGPVDLLDHFLEHSHFRSKSDLRPLAARSFGQVILYNGGRESRDASVRELYSLCFTALGRPRPLWWTRFTRLLTTAGPAAPLLLCFLLTRLLRYALFS